MPLLQQDNRRGGGSRDNRRSFGEFVGFDNRQATQPAAAPRASSSNGNDDWQWEMPGSPEAAQTPRSLVPPKCFPTGHPSTFSSYSDRARRGSWAEPSGHRITDLVASMSLTMPSSRVSSSDVVTGRSCDSLQTVTETQWTQTRAERTNRREQQLSRRASFCGATGAENKTAPLVWSGVLPPRSEGGQYSSKVFLGGLPWDTSEQALLHLLRNFNPIRIEWPGRSNSSLSGGNGGLRGGPRGFVYVTFENELCVKALLKAAHKDGNAWYFRVFSNNSKSKEVEVIPWSIADSICVVGGSAKLDPFRTVFVGALHGMLSAEALATIMNDLFQGVVHAGIDTDKNKYPIGSGRVTFNNLHSYVCALSVGFVEIRTDKFTKKVQIDPYLEDSMCSMCKLQQGPYFCRSPICFSYYCRSCWARRHAESEHNHKPLMRNFKTNEPLPVSLAGNSGNSNMSVHSDCGTRRTPSDQSSLNGGFCVDIASTPSPFTSGASTSDHATEEISEWLIQ
ncbi:unnamed protein product [Leptosia nina]|uniref:RRM domain-containing protein n=1 Tax=Leptosia nina TaxID=320188 RepID=A0AAV1J5Y9_9NEOP